MVHHTHPLFCGNIHCFQVESVFALIIKNVIGLVHQVEITIALVHNVDSVIALVHQVEITIAVVHIGRFSHCFGTSGRNDRWFGAPA